MEAPRCNLKECSELEHSYCRNPRGLILSSFGGCSEFYCQYGRRSGVEAGVVVGIHSGQHRVQTRLRRPQGAEGCYIRSPVEPLNQHTVVSCRTAFGGEGPGRESPEW